MASAYEGRRIPDLRLRLADPGATPEGGREVSTRELFGGRTVIAFALPGAFTPTCSSQHLPRYEELVSEFRAHGVDEVLCIAVNDAYVMAEWGTNQGLKEVKLLADGNGEFSQAMGLIVDGRSQGLGLRSRRYSMLVKDARIEKMFLEAEEPGDPYRVSDADTMLEYLAPRSRRPPRIAIFTKPGCPYCAAAKRRLREQNLRFEEIALNDAVRGRVLGAVAGAATAPQVFVDGRLIGDSKGLDRWLESQAHPETTVAA